MRSFRSGELLGDSIYFVKGSPIRGSGQTQKTLSSPFHNGLMGDPFFLACSSWAEAPVGNSTSSHAMNDLLLYSCSAGTFLEYDAFSFSI